MIFVWGEDVEQHDMTLRQVLDRCRERNLELNRGKCHFQVPEVHYVGHVLSAGGVKLFVLVQPTCLRRVHHSASYSRKMLNGPGDK